MELNSSPSPGHADMSGFQCVWTIEGRSIRPRNIIVGKIDGEHTLVTVDSITLVTSGLLLNCLSSNGADGLQSAFI